MNEPTDLHWLAFCYVADQMSEDDRLQFEARLDGDQAAREAVALAVELGQAVLFVESERQHTITVRRDDQTQWGTRLVWMVAGCALCLALVWGVQQWSGSRSANLNHAPESVNLANAWGELRVVLHDDPELWPAPDNSLIDEPLLSVIETVADDEGDPVANWIAVAVVGLSDQPAGENVDDGSKGL